LIDYGVVPAKENIFSITCDISRLTLLNKEKENREER
jgi:hypothetical protein